jgi:prepilin-type N-terminal cleavage/methylation domain-containing protein
MKSFSEYTRSVMTAFSVAVTGSESQEFLKVGRRSAAMGGFTLIELLVVIAIIGILSSIVLTSLSSSRYKARDAGRLSDMHQLENALEAYESDNNGYYPGTGTNSQVADMVPSLVPRYLSTLPADPTYTGSNGYRYHASTDKTGYTMLVHLEKNAGLSPSWCSIGTGWTNWVTAYPACY